MRHRRHRGSVRRGEGRLDCPHGSGAAWPELYVFIVDDQNRAEVRQVKVAHEGTTTAVISNGLKEADRVVTSGQFLLQPGSIVSIDTGSGT